MTEEKPIDSEKKPLIPRAKRFVTETVWQAHLDTLPWWKRSLYKLIRLCGLTVTSIRKNRCNLHAASLTFFSLMALIPILAMTLALARAFGGDDLAKRKINEALDGWMSEMEAGASASEGEKKELPPPAEKPSEGVASESASAANAVATGTGASAPVKSHAEVTREFSAQMRSIVNDLLKQLDQISFGTLGGIGAAMLLWTVIGTLGKVEETFNEVWHVAKPRPIQRKMCDYLFTILILPFLMLAASTVPVAAKVTEITSKTLGHAASGFAASLLQSGLFKLATTIFFSSLFFAFLLGFMPNTKVKVKPAMVGGFVTAILFAFWFKLCTMLQIGIGKYSALYGGFAMLPILLAWLYTSWEIIIIGAEIAFALQNRDTFIYASNALQASVRSRILLGLTLCAQSARLARTQDGGVFHADEFSKTANVPFDFSRALLNDLVAQKILAKVENGEGESDGYLLCKCGGTLTVAEIIRKLLDNGADVTATGLQELDAEVLDCGRRLDEALEQSFRTPIAELGNG